MPPVLLFLLASMSGQQSATSAAERVGELGRLDRLVVQGATAFAPEQIRDGLAGDPQLFLLSTRWHRAMPISSCWARECGVDTCAAASPRSPSP